MTDRVPRALDHNATDSEAYLSDAQGRSVTPIIRPFEANPTTTNNTTAGAAGEATSRVLPFGLSRKPPAPVYATAEERKAAAEIEKLERRKREVGVLMEKGGATWANAKRRRGFLDDEEFEDEVESEGEHAPEDA